MNIKTHHSSSSKNLYQVDDLLLEAGAPIREIKQALGFRLSEVRACLVSHYHGDHAKGAEDLMKAGIDLYCSQGTAEALKLSGHRLHIVEAKHQVDIGPWRIMPFDVAHDAVESLGFLLAKGDEKLVFAVDTNYIPYRFSGLTHIMLGVNYSVNILRESVRAGQVDTGLANRILRNHMSLQTALDFFRANDMGQVQEIHLLHLSDGNSDEEKFKNEVERVTGRPVYV